MTCPIIKQLFNMCTTNILYIWMVDFSCLNELGVRISVLLDRFSDYCMFFASNINNKCILQLNYGQTLHNAKCWSPRMLDPLRRQFC